jgi:hypothetical protein
VTPHVSGFRLATRRCTNCHSAALQRAATAKCAPAHWRTWHREGMHASQTAASQLIQCTVCHLKYLTCVECRFKSLVCKWSADYPPESPRCSALQVPDGCISNVYGTGLSTSCGCCCCLPRRQVCLLQAGLAVCESAGTCHGTPQETFLEVSVAPMQPCAQKNAR